MQLIQYAVDIILLVISYMSTVFIDDMSWWLHLQHLAVDLARHLGFVVHIPLG